MEGRDLARFADQLDAGVREKELETDSAVCTEKKRVKGYIFGGRLG